MGVSTDAYLAYGVAVEEGEYPFGTEEDRERWAAQDRDVDYADIGWWLAYREGHESPYDVELPREINEGSMEDYTAWKAEHPEFEAHVKEYGEIKDRLEEECPVEIVTHCSYEYPMYVVALKGTQQHAWRGDPVEASTPLITDLKTTEADEYCAAHGLPSFGEADWLLFSWWG